MAPLPQSTSDTVADETPADEDEAAIRAAFEGLAIDGTPRAEPETPADRAPEACPVDTAHRATTPGRWPVRSSWYEGGERLDEALEDSQRSHAPLLLYFYTDWCGYCRLLEDGLFSDTTVRRFLRDRVVKLRVNPEDGPRDREVADRYGVSGYPTLRVVSQPTGDSRRISPYLPGGGARLLPPGDFVLKLESAEESSRKAFVAQSRALLGSESYGEAIEAAEAALAIDPETFPAFECRARAQLALGRLDAALQDLRACADGQRHDPTPYALAAEALAGTERWAESAACLGEVLARRPGAATYFARAEALAAAGDLAGAVEDARRACDLGEARACGWEPRSPARSAS